MKHDDFTSSKKPYLHYKNVLEDLGIRSIPALGGVGSKDRIEEVASFWKFSPTLLHLELSFSGNNYKDHL